MEYISHLFDIELNEFGKTLRERRITTGLKVYEFAKLVNVNPVYITEIEIHKKLPSISTAIKIKQVLEKTEKDFLKRNDFEPWGEYQDIMELYLQEKCPEFLDNYQIKYKER